MCAEMPQPHIDFNVLWLYLKLEIWYNKGVRKTSQLHIDFTGCMHCRAGGFGIGRSVTNAHQFWSVAAHIGTPVLAVAKVPKACFQLINVPSLIPGESLDLVPK